MLKSVKAGRPINEEDIPPVVVIREKEHDQPLLSNNTPSQVVDDSCTSALDYIPIQSIDDDRKPTPASRTVPQSVAFPSTNDQVNLFVINLFINKIFKYKVILVNML